MTDGTAEYNATTTASRSSTTWPRRRVPAHGVRARPRARPARRDRRRADAGLAALGDDAGALRRDRGELARRLGRVPHFAISETPATSAGRSRRWPPTRTWRAGTGRRSPAASSRRSTASPTSTAAGRTPGATWSRSRTRAGRPTRATAEPPSAEPPSGDPPSGRPVSHPHLPGATAEPVGEAAGQADRVRRRQLHPTRRPGKPVRNRR